MQGPGPDVAPAVADDSGERSGNGATGPGTAAPDDPVRRRSDAAAPSPWGWPDVVALLLVVAPFAVATLRVLTWSDPVPLADEAALDLDVRNASGWPDWFGSYSQYGFRHPGPFLTWWMTAFRGVVDRTAAFAVGMVALNLVLVLVAVLTGRRRWGRAGLVGASVGLGGLALAAGWDVLATPWNPMVAVLGVPAFLLIATVAWSGDRAATVIALVVATACVQAHLGNAVLCAAVLGVVFVAQLVDRRLPLGTVAWTWAIALAATLPLWAAPLAEQLARGRDGNLWRIVSFGRSGPVPRTGWGPAGEAALRAFRGRPTWLGGTNAVEGVADRGFPAWLVATAAVLVGAGAVIVQRRVRGTWTTTPRTVRDPLRATVLSAVALSAGALALAVGRGPVRSYYTIHLEAAAAALVLAAGWLAVATIAATRRPPRSAAVAPAVGWALLVATSGLLTTAALRADSPAATLGTRADAVVAAVEDLEPDGGRVVVSRASSAGGPLDFGDAMGVFNALDAAGVDVVAGPDTDLADGRTTTLGLRLAVPRDLVGRAGPGDVEVVLVAAGNGPVPSDWRRLGTVAPNLTVWERPAS